MPRVSVANWLTTREIADRYNLDPRNLHTKLGRMFGLGLVQRRRDPSNPAKWQWIETEQAKELYGGRKLFT